MTRLLLLLVLACCLATSHRALGGDLISPGSEEWKGIFDPPYEAPTEVPKDSPLRKTLFDLLRPAMEKKTKQKVLFEGTLRAYKNWAVFTGRTVNADGSSVKFPPMDNDDTAALWLRTKDGWRLVDYNGGHSDAFYIIWPEQYGVPKAFFEVE